MASQGDETCLAYCLSANKNVDQRENSGSRARGSGLALAFLSGKPGDGIAATATPMGPGCSETPGGWTSISACRRKSP